MADKPSVRSRRDPSKSGIMPRPVLEPENRREPPMPQSAAEIDDQDKTTTTGRLPIVTEGEDRSAEREHDPATRG